MPQRVAYQDIRLPGAVRMGCTGAFIGSRRMRFARCSMLLATIVCFACRYLVNAAAYWLLDVRGPQTAWTLTSGILGGLFFPVWFFPHAMAIGLIVATPFPSVIQIPLDILVERGPLTEQLGLLGVQGGWVAALLVLCVWVQRRGERKLVVQGG